MTTPSNQNISIACYIDDNNQLQISLSDNLESEETSNYFDFDAKELVENFAINLTQEIYDSIKDQIAKTGGGWVEQFSVAGPVFTLGLTYDFLNKLHEERQINGDDGFKDYTVAAARTIYETAIGVTTGALAVTALATAGVGIPEFLLPAS